ncbi:MAG: ferredoxin family protein [Acidimicrobiales bacterium]
MTETLHRQTLPSPKTQDWSNVADAPSTTTPSLGLEALVELTEFRIGARAHIVVDTQICQNCDSRACLNACPAGLFVETAQGSILFNYEYCFECGTCDLICNQAGALSWSYPQGGDGVVFRHG